MSEGKPTLGELGVDVDGLNWQRSSSGSDAIEIAMVEALGRQWVLLRAGGDLVSVFSRHEWECFLDGARNGEFDDAL
ncbi:hypothetical protein [Plantactinospora sp. CA-290183]|uniref:hypothetical protein n=1 Tax=Plantactinospora sp. CA-290183 TaxID=3240006 RepID=UPI003D9210D3